MDEVMTPRRSAAGARGRLPADASSGPARVSVVVPCHDYARFLDEAIASALSQEGVDVDVTVVDDASTDGSLELAQAWARRDPRVRVRSHTVNQGHIATFNEALASATAPYVVKLDPDDVLPPGTLRRSVDVLERHPEVVFVYGPVLPFRGATPTELPTDVSSVRVWSGDRWLWWRALLLRNVIYQPEVMVRRSALDRAGGHRPDVPAASDLNLWLRLATLGAVARINGPVQGLYRKHPGSMQTTVHAGKLVDFRARRDAFLFFVDEVGDRLPDPGAFRRGVSRRLARDAVRLAFEELADGADVSEYLSEARTLWPGVARTAAWWSITRQAGVGRPTWWGAYGRCRRDLEGRLRWRAWRRFGL